MSIEEQMDFPTEMHRTAFDKILWKLTERRDVKGIWVIGSLASGNAKESSDIDLYVISEKIPGDGEILIIDGIEIQIQWRTPEHLKKVLDLKQVSTTMLRYNKSVYDPCGILKDAEKKLKEKFAGPYPLDDSEITAIRIFLSTLLEEMKEIEEDPYYFNYIYYDRIHRLILYFYELNRLWKPLPKYIISNLKETDKEFYKLICKAYEVTEIEEKTELIAKISGKCLALTDGLLYEGLYRIF